jgi:DNA-binding LacI/PurR family transcriptional regulator
MGKNIHEIAALSGVSIGTVSRVMNKRPGVHPETKKRVEEIVQKFGYQPSAMARGLKRQRSDTVMLLVPNLTDIYYAQLVNHLSQLVRQQGRRLLLGISDWDPAVEAGYLRQVADGAVDGLIVSPVGQTENLPLYLELALRQFPVVAIEDPCVGIPFPTVKYNDVAGAADAVRYLIGKGHKRIAFCAANMQIGTVRDRHQGYLEAHIQAGLPMNKQLILANDTKDFCCWNCDKLIARIRAANPPTALLAENDFLALRIIRCLTDAGIKVPGDVAVVGFDNVYTPELLAMPLTSVSLPWQELCRRTLEILIARIEHPEIPADNQPELLMPKLAKGKTA